MYNLKKEKIDCGHLCVSDEFVCLCPCSYSEYKKFAKRLIELAKLYSEEPNYHTNFVAIDTGKQKILENRKRVE